MGEMAITVHDCASICTQRPVTGGVPLSRADAPPGTQFTLHNCHGEAVPLQWEVTGRWEDDSARWVLVDLQSNPPADGQKEYTLRWSDAAGPVMPETPCEADAGACTASTGDLHLAPSDDALITVRDRADISLILRDADGRQCASRVRDTVVESAGPLRSALNVQGSFHRPDGRRWFSFCLRVSIFAGLSFIRLEPLIVLDADEGVMQHIQELRLAVRPHDRLYDARIGGEAGSRINLADGFRLLQVDDRQVEAAGETFGDKNPGWIEADSDAGSMALAVRDFWQQWPKSLEASSHEIAIGLFPTFEAGQFEHMEPWYKYQYLFEGNCYRLRTGQARRWDVWIDLDGDGASLSATADRPLIPIADPRQAIATGVWGDIEPAGSADMKDYDKWAHRLFEAYERSIAKQRDYGAMNWGDWFGERKVNWGNHEYDTTNQFLIQFARTGNPAYFYAADTAARHSVEVDTIHHINDDLRQHFDQIINDPEAYGNPEPHYPFRPGMVHQHTVGHVSGFYSVETIRDLFVEHGIGSGPNPYLCLRPTNLGHLWTQGTSRHSFVAGDTFVRQTVLTIGNNLAQLAEDREYEFLGHSHSGRIAGWTMLALAGAYEIEFAERFLQAMQIIAQDALQEQDPNCGGWIYQPLPDGHCNCERFKHTGMAGFITAVLVNGLSRYYELSGDDRMPECIDRAVRFLDLDTWHERWRGWRYTSCPATALRGVSQPGVTMMAHVNGARLGEDPEHLRILDVAWREKFRALVDEETQDHGFGKTYASTMYGCPETVALLAKSTIPAVSKPYSDDR
ncbi:MAG: hypothetical protein ACLFWB_07260 [Armatimonadota bacterium]